MISKLVAMSIIAKFVGFVLPHFFRHGNPHARSTASVIDNFVESIEDYFTDHLQMLPLAIARTNDRTCQAPGIALARDTDSFGPCHLVSGESSP